MNWATARRDPAWYTPADLPDEVVAFDDSVRGNLGVGAAGKVGLLELVLAPESGVTRLRQQYHQAPFYIYRPIYLDPCQPGMAFIFVLQSGDGLVQGDRYRVDIDCQCGAAAHITSQAATNVFRSRHNFATQLVNLRADAGAVLEYLPDPIVPFRGSRFFQRLRVVADRESTVLLGEMLLPGRVARGETHAYDFVWNETEVRRPDGSLLFSDVLRLNPSSGEEPRSMGLLGPYDVIATLYVISQQLAPRELVAALRGSLDACPEVLVGVSELPNDAGAGVRLLGSNSMAVHAARATAWNAARLAVLGSPAPNLRKGATQSSY